MTGIVIAVLVVLLIALVVWQKPDKFRCLLKGLGFEFEISSERRPPPE